MAADLLGARSLQVGADETLKESGWRMGPVDEAEGAAGVEGAGGVRRGDGQRGTKRRPTRRRRGWRGRLVAERGASSCSAAVRGRDFRDIGHKAIYVANSFRTLQCIGWQHAEPVLRSLAYALLKYDGQNPSKSDQAADRPGRRNVGAGEEDPGGLAGWEGERRGFVASAGRRCGRRRSEEMCAAVVEASTRGWRRRSIWDALLAGSAELLTRKTGIVTLHSVTSSNALRFAYETSSDPQTRLMMLLQNAAFVPLFREAAGKLSDRKIDAMEGAEGEVDVAAVFANVGKDRPAAAGRRWRTWTAGVTRGR